MVPHYFLQKRILSHLKIKKRKRDTFSPCLTTKTKVVIFSKKKVRQNQSFKIKGQNIEIIDSYCYLGTLLNYNGNFCTARKKITEQAHKALDSKSFKDKEKKKGYIFPLLNSSV
jgi:hypothetical protein